MKLKLLFSLAFLALVLPTFAQQNTGTQDDWTLITTDHNVSVYYEQGSCNNNSVVFVRIVNNNPTAALVDFNLWEGGQAKKLEVQPNETITGVCQNLPRVFLLTERIPAGKTVKDLHPVIQINVQR